MTGQTPHSGPFQGFYVEQEVPLRRYTSFRVGGPAEFLAAPESVEMLAGLLRAAKANAIPVMVLGGGTNVLVSDKGIRGLVVLLTGLKGEPELKKTGQGTVMNARAGMSLASLCRLAMDKGLAGLEWAAGIPGTLGGAVMMNAGSFGSDMASVVASIEVLDLGTLEISTLERKDLDFSYRQLEMKNTVILGTCLFLADGDATDISRAYDRNLRHKKATQPVSKASAGCFFKNPSPEKPAGWLIEQSGLKGYAHKGAMVSDVHANFIINHDRATCRDILELADLVTGTVRKKFNIELEKEVKIIGR
jgi:UDP-N-acetylmuramate dehydrogenase